MIVPTVDEWRRSLIERCRKRLDPFDGRQQDMLLGFGLELARVSRGSRLVLRPLRPLFGERLVRRYVAVYVSAGLLVMVERPTRGTADKPGRMAVYELRIPTESLPLSPHDAGNDSYDLKGQRFRPAEHEPAPSLEPAGAASRARSLPGYTLKPSCLYVGTSRSERGTTILRLVRDAA